MALKKRKDKKIEEGGRSNFYTSLEEWEADNFPNLIRRKAWEELEEDPEAVGTAIADDILRRVGVELLRIS